MRGARVLIGSPAPTAEKQEGAEHTQREPDAPISEATGLGFAASVCAACVLCAVLLIQDAGAGGARLEQESPIVVLLLASMVAVAHAWDGRRRASSGAHGLIVRHRVTLLVFGLACSWAGLQRLQAPTEGMRDLAAGFLMLQAGLGGSAAVADRPSLTIWLLTVVMVPAGWILSAGEAAGRHLGWLLLVAGMIVSGSALRFRQMVAHAQRVRRENDHLVAQLRQQVVLVEAANAEKSRFLGAASHDLRQPMHALGLFAAALEKALRGTPNHHQVVSMVRAVDALEDSFGAMLDVSRLDAGVVQPNMQAFPIRDLFRRLHMHCAGHAEERGLALRFKAGGKVVTSDPQLLERVLGNLVHNAIRYTPSGGVVVVARTRPQRTSIEVWDTGIGIPANELPKIFNEFYQVENTGRDRTRGLGMGLSIVKRLVLLLGHELEVRSEPGRGTVFRLLLRATDLAEMPSVVLGADTVPSSPDEHRTVLIIDDEEAVRVGMQQLLESWGFSVLLAATITEARQAIRRHAGVIDVVLSDLRLSMGEDGIQAIADVRKEYGAPLPAILITGDTSTSEVLRAHDSGQLVLFKPVRPRDLFAALRRVP